MSHFPQNSAQPPPHCLPEQLFPDLAQLAEKLHGIAQALMAFCESRQAESGSENGQDDKPQTTEKPSELRTYRVPWYIVNEERKMLEQSGAQDWQDMFHQCLFQLCTLATLMQHFDREEDTEGLLLNQIAEHLMEPSLDKLSRLCSLIADFKLQMEE